MRITRRRVKGGEDLVFLEHLPEKGAGIRLHGVVYSGFELVVVDQPPRLKGVAGIIVTVKGVDGKMHRLKTDELGEYEITELKNHSAKLFSKMLQLDLIQQNKD